MNTPSVKYRRDDGWTFIEATISIVIMAIMVLGLTIVLLAFREQLDRSWAVRVMDQYGNDVIEQLTHELRNAIEVDVRSGAGNTDRIDVTYLDPIRHDLFLTARWRADLRNVRITRDGEKIDPTFPPQNLGRGESYEIVSFTLNQYGEDSPNNWERQDRNRRKQSFLDAAYDLRFKLRYNRNAIDVGERNWTVEKEYFNRVYVRNKNLIVKKGITD
jgi:type II secretory pathway pseudopilin PulG